MIVLIGYMGSGKSAVGEIVSKENGKVFVDLDQYIEQQEKMSIPEIFENKGEIYFRKKEYFYLKEVLETQKDIVLSVGGGTPCYGENMKLITEATPHVFYLKATIETLLERLLKEKDHRPMISHLEDSELAEFIRKHLFERNFYYLQSRHKINVDDLSAAEVAEKLRELL
ncbi:shikimate kinase [Leptobacterium flavescens]|uniref:Shikimate kinase n=1 Tax=Leptobacterium flavescens TaxID=472055 RepID=A0A6P0UXY5_9FLAO|nr:shikimate kinase [Leptobacterium flavescens]NER15553.1 shikimate kinase [Leptobacterium flavescens]